MTAGYPDWASGQLLTPPNVASFQNAGAGVGDVVLVVTTPPAGQRVRLVGYRLVMSLAVTLGVNAGLSTITVSIQSSAGALKERSAIYLRALASNVANGALDSGLVVVPGGGLALPVNETLNLRRITTSQVGASIDWAVHFTRYWLTETP